MFKSWRGDVVGGRPGPGELQLQPGARLGRQPCLQGSECTPQAEVLSAERQWQELLHEEQEGKWKHLYIKQS